MTLHKRTVVFALLVTVGLFFVAAPVMAGRPWDDNEHGKGNPGDGVPFNPNGDPTWDEQMLIDEGLLPDPPKHKNGQLPSLDDHPWGGEKGGSGSPAGPGGG